jgi:hypothetical protein
VAAGTTAATAQVAYVPPDAAQPRFGGEFRMSEPGSVAGYWPTACKVLRDRAQQNRAGPPATPAIAATLKGFLSGLIAKQPTYDALTPAMAAAVRKNIDIYWPDLNHMGGPTVTKKVSKDKAGNDIYVVNLEGGRTHWNVSVSPQGKIDRAIACLGVETGIHFRLTCSSG